MNKKETSEIKKNFSDKSGFFVMERVMTDVMYSVPSDPTIEKVVITADCVTGDSEPEITHRAEQAG